MRKKRPVKIRLSSELDHLQRRFEEQSVSSKAQDVRTATAKRNPNRMMRYTATRSTAFCAPRARSGGLGSVRVEAMGFRQREQTGARVLTSLPQAGQEIDAIPVRALSSISTAALRQRRTFGEENTIRDGRFSHGYRVMMGVYIFGVLSTLMLSLLVIVLFLYRSMKLLEKIAAAVAVLPPRIVQKPVAKTEKGL
jgi:hypothetical protein